MRPAGVVIFQTAEFSDWLVALADRLAKARIVARIDAAQAGHFGDCKPVGHGISEMRIHHGSGYRVYFKRTGDVIYVLLCAGTKSSQAADIRRARAIADALKDRT